MDCSWPLEGNSAEKLNKVVDMLSFMLTLLHSVEDGRFSSIEVATNAETHRKAAEAFGIDRYSVCQLIVDVAPEAKNFPISLTRWCVRIIPMTLSEKQNLPGNTKNAARI